MSGGFEKLQAQIVEYVTDEVADLHEAAMGDSPIERLLYYALVGMTRFGSSEYHHVETPTPARPVAKILEQAPPTSLVVVPQHQFPDWRVDFLIYAWDFGHTTQRPGWRRLIVECDGHDFHERTKDQAKRDRARDRQAQLLGMSIMRFTGSEIHNDPLGCARQISEWGTIGWF